jgi:hypothetical protein
MKRKILFLSIYFYFGLFVCISQGSKDLEQKPDDTTKITFKLKLGYSFYKANYNNVADDMDLKYAKSVTFGFLLSVVKNLELEGDFAYYTYKVNSHYNYVNYDLVDIPFYIGLKYTFQQENYSPYIGLGVLAHNFILTSHYTNYYYEKSDQTDNYHSILVPFGCSYKINNDFDLDFGIKFSFISSNFIMDAIKTDIGIIYKF